MHTVHRLDQPEHAQNLIRVSITKTCLYNFDPLKPHFYIVKLGFRGVYIIFLISAQSIHCGYSLEPPQRTYQSFLSEIFHFLLVNVSVYLNRRVFVMSQNLSIHTFCSIQDNCWDGEGPNQTPRKRSLIWAFAVHICLKTGFLMARPIFYINQILPI